MMLADRGPRLDHVLGVGEKANQVGGDSARAATGRSRVEVGGDAEFDDHGGGLAARHQHGSAPPATA